MNDKRGNPFNYHEEIEHSQKLLDEFQDRYSIVREERMDFPDDEYLAVTNALRAFRDVCETRTND